MTDEELLKQTLEVLNQLEITLAASDITNYGGMYGFDDRELTTSDVYESHKLKLRLIKNQIDRILSEDWDTLKNDEDQYYSSTCR